MKKSFILYTDQLDVTLADLTDSEAGILFKSLLSWQKGEPIEPEDRIIRLLYSQFVAQFERDNESYRQKSERNAEAQRKRWEYARIRSNTNVSYSDNVSESDNDNDNVSGSVSVSKEKKVKKEIDLSFCAEDMRPVFEEWLSYKRERRETYKTARSLKECYNKLVTYSEGNPETALIVIRQSIGNNYAGLFPLKSQPINHGYSTKFERQVRSEQQLGAALASQCASQISAEQSSSTGKGGFMPPSLFK